MNMMKALAIWELVKQGTQVTIVSLILVYACIGIAETHADECAPLFSITDEQWQVLQLAYDTGAPYNLGNTMAAIAWTESTAGKYRVNPESKDYGVMQNNIKTASIRRGVEGYYPIRALMTELVVNDQLSIDLALEELLYWDQHTDSWASMVSAYNNGWAYKHGTDHTQLMRTNTRMMMNCAQLDHMFNEEQPMHEDAVGDLVASFNNNTQLTLEPKVVGSYTGTHTNGTSMANSSKKPTMWGAFTTRLSRVWT